MKLRAIALLLLPLATPLQAELPTRFEILTTQYEAAVERVVSPIRTNYVRELRALEAELARAGKKAEAEIVAKERAKVEMSTFRLEEILLNNEWIYSNGRSKSTVRFREGGKAEVQGKDS